jgi:hypothetical protein
MVLMAAVKSMIAAKTMLVARLNDESNDKK